MPLQTSAVIQQLEDRTLLSSVVTVGPEQQVNSFTADSQVTSPQSSPNVAVAANGDYVVTWSSNTQDGSGYGVFAQLFAANGTPAGGEFQVNEFTTGNQQYSSVSMFDTGEFIVTWSSEFQDGEGWGIFARRYDAGGNALGSEFQVNTHTASDQIYSSVSVSETGRFIVAWGSKYQDGSSTGIYAQRYDESGNPLGSEFQVNTHTADTQYLASVSMADSDEFVVAWTSWAQDGDGWGVFAQKYDASSVPIGNEFRVNSNTASDQLYPSVSMANSGEFVVTWNSWYQDGSGSGIYGQRYDTSGNPLGNEFRVNGHTSGDQRFSSVSLADAGDFLVTWSSYSQDGSGWGVYAQRFDAIGNTVGEEFRVNTLTASDQLYSSLTLNNAGECVIAWTDVAQDGSGNGVYAQRFSLVERDATTVGFEQQVNTFTPSTQQTTQISSRNVAIAENGDHLVVWTSAGQDGDSYGIFAQRFDADGHALGGEFQVNTITASAQRDPSVAMTSTGEFVVVWSSSDASGNDDIFARRYADNGAAIGAEFRVNTFTTSVQAQPSVSVVDSGDFVVSWTSVNQDGSLTGVFAQRYDADGNAIGGEFQVNTFTTGRQMYSSVSVAETGAFVIVWASDTQDGSGWGIYAQRYDSGGQLIGSEFRVNSTTQSSQLYPSVVMSESGAFIISWSSLSQDGSSYGVFARRYDSNGNSIGDEFQVNTYTTGNQHFSSVSMANTGEFVITWTSAAQDGDGNGVYAQQFDANGNSLGSEFRVNSNTLANQEYASVALNNAGQFVIAWTSDGQDGDTFGVYSQRFSLDIPPLVTVGREQRVNTYTTGNQQTTTFRVPSVAIAKNGDYVVTWSSDFQDGSSTGVYAQRFDANGNALGSEFQVNTYTTGSQNSPAIAMSESGEFVIVWNGDGQGGFGIHGQRFDADGNPLGSEFQVNSYLDSQTHVTVAMSDSGDFVIAWSSGSQDGDQYGIFAQRYDANGNAIGGEFQVNTYTVGRQWFPSVSIAATGEFVIVWTSDFQDGDDRGVYAQRYDADGNTVGGEFRVTTTTADRQYTPYVSMANTGEFVVAWASNNQDGDLLGVFAQRYAADGSPVGDEFLVNKTTLGIQALPSVSMANTGEFVITWESYNQGGNDWGIFGQRYDADGNALGDEFQVNTNTASDQRYPSIALNDAGQFVVAWTDTAQDGSGNGVYSQRYRILYEPPSVAVDSASVSVDEGNTAANTGTYSDAEGFAVTLTASVGTVLNNGDGTWSWSWDTSDGPDDSQTVTITATSVRGLSTDTTFDLTVQNVAPVITGVGDTSTTPGSPITITANITDAGVDTPFSIVWDMGDGTTFNDLTEVTHTYAASGEYFASLTVTDSDGAETTKDFRVVIAPPVTITASQTVLEEAAIIPVGTEHQVNSTTLGDQTTEYITPSNVAVAGNGDYVITWVSYDGNGQGVFAQRFDANGNSLGGEFQVNTYTTSNQLYSSVAMATSGEFIITWSSLNQDGSGYGIYAQRYDANGNTVGGEFRVNTYTANYQIYSTVSIAETGAFVITWSSDGQDGDGNGVYARLYDASGNPVGGEFRVNTYTVSSQSIPAVSMTDTGNFIITWSSFQDGNGFGVYAQRYDAGGTRIGSEFQVNTHTAGDQLWPSVSMVDSGKFVITWSSSDQDGSSWGIYAQRYDAVGNALGSEFQVNTYTHSFQSRSSASMTDSGDFLVTWDSYGQDGSDLGVYAQAYDGQGNLLGTEIRVNTYTQSVQYAASVSNNGTGQFVVTWSSALQDGSGYGVYAQRFALTSSDVDVFATIDNPLSEDVVIPLTYTGTAIPDVDFEQVGQPGVAPTQIVIPAGQTSGSVTIRNVADSLDEDVESLSIHFGVPSNASLASADPINIQLLDDDAEPAVFLSSVGQTLHEQDLSLPVTVSLSEVSGRDVTVNLSTSGTATLGMDYTFDNPVVVIPAGQLSAGTVLQLLDDTVGEGAEQIQVQIDSADYATVPATPGQPASLTHLINLNDTPTMQFASVLRQVSETDGTYNVLLTLSNESTSPITTTITLSGDATIGDDYTSALGTIFDVTFDPGETEKTISVTLVNDETQEADKSLLFQTTNLFGSTITHQARIIDDDSTFVTVTTTPATVWEDTGLVTITATLSKAYDAGSGIDVLVPISFSSDLQNGVEFFADTTPILIPAGATTATRGIALVDNDTPGSDEVITVNVGTTDHARLLSNENLSIVVREDDPRVSFDGFGQTASAKTISVSESSGTVKIPVFLNRRVNDTIFVPVSVYSTQMSRSEYDLVSATVQIQAGDDRGYVEIDINDDGTFESTESLTVKLGTGTGFTLEPTSSDRTRTVEVTDDESPPIPVWSTSAIVTNEGAGVVKTKLKLSHASATAVDVVVSVSNKIYFVSPTRDLTIDGFTLSSSGRWFKTYRYSKTFTFAPNQTELPIEIRLVNDNTYESTETFIFSASRPGSSVQKLDMVIYDNDVRQALEKLGEPVNSGSGGGGGNWLEELLYIPPGSNDKTPAGLSWKTFFGGDGFADGATAFFDANFNQVPDFVDANGNGVLDEGELVEPIAESNYDGSVAIPSLVDFDLNQDGVIDSMEGQIVFRGGVDSSTGQPFLVPLVTPIAYPVASPLSTLVSAIQESQGLDVLSAEAVAANALSIPEQAYLRSHLIPLTNSGDAVAAQSFAASAMIYGTASQMAAFISGLQGGVPTDLAGRLVFAEMAALLTEPDALLDLTEPVVIDSILRGAIARSGATLPAGDELSTAVDVIVAINEQFAAIPVEGTREYLESVAHIQVVANGQSPDDLVLLANGTVSSATIQSTYFEAGLQQQIANSEILNVVVPYVLTSNAQIIEGDSGTSLLQVDVSLSDASNLPVTVNYATQDYTAVAGEDYDSIAGQLSWAAGETTTHTLQIPILGDTEFEADEQFHLAFTDAVNAAVLETLSTLSIHNDDLASFTIESPAGDLDYLIETDSSGILIEESGEALFGGTLAETPLLTLEGSAGVRNDFTFRAGLDAVSPVDGFRVVGAGPDDTLTIDAQFAESLQHIITGSGTGLFLVNGVTLSYENIATINSPASPIFTLLPTTPLELGDSPMFAIDVPGFDSELPSETIWTITHDEMVIATGMGQAATIPDLELGTYRIDFLATQEGRLTTGISYEFEVRPAPVVIGTAVNGGDNNRSGIRELTFTFDQAVMLGSPTVLNLFNHATGLPVDLSGAVLVGDGTTAVTWVLHDGPGGMTDVVLADGRYTAELPAGATTPNLAQTHTFAFHKLAGDIDGDGAVNFNDTVPLSLSFGVTGGPIFGPGDGDGDGDVNFNDTVPLSLNFGATLAALTLDLGDAPDSATFPTTLANDGARHVITGNTLFLGTTRDAETNGQPNATATGDDIAGMADEDGVVISGGSLLFGTPVNVTVTASVPSSAVINGWVDFNGDGDWDDAGEHVFVDVAIVHGANPLSITAPGSSVASPIARFRLTETAGYSYFGLAPNGEVEDYQLSVTSPPPAALETVTLGNGQTNPRQNFGRLRSLQLFSNSLVLGNNNSTLGTSTSESTSIPAPKSTVLTPSLLTGDDDSIGADGEDPTTVANHASKGKGKSRRD